jgi:hypothetical protein
MRIHPAVDAQTAPALLISATIASLDGICGRDATKRHHARCPPITPRRRRASVIVAGDTGRIRAAAAVPCQPTRRAVAISPLAARRDPLRSAFEASERTTLLARHKPVWVRFRFCAPYLIRAAAGLCPNIEVRRNTISGFLAAQSSAGHAAPAPSWLAAVYRATRAESTLSDAPGIP